MSGGGSPKPPPTPAPIPTPVASVEQKDAVAKARRKGKTGRESLILAGRMMQAKNPYEFDSILSNTL